MLLLVEDEPGEKVSMIGALRIRRPEAGSA
jgi:hypothetical protein